MKIIKPVLFFSLLLFVAGCTKEIKPGTVTVICDKGYGGSGCLTKLRDRFFGDYHVTGQCTAGGANFLLRIEAMPGNEVWKMQLVNLASSGDTAIAEVATDSTFAIPQQTIDNRTVTGSGTMHLDSTLTINYTIDGNTCDTKGMR